MFVYMALKMQEQTTAAAHFLTALNSLHPSLIKFTMELPFHWNWDN